MNQTKKQSKMVNILLNSFLYRTASRITRKILRYGHIVFSIP